MYEKLLILIQILLMVVVVKLVLIIMVYYIYIFQLYKWNERKSLIKLNGFQCGAVVQNPLHQCKHLIYVFGGGDVEKKECSNEIYIYDNNNDGCIQHIEEIPFPRNDFGYVINDNQ